MQTDKFDCYGALWMLCNRWHSGQYSLGYRILSRLSIIGYSPGLSVTSNHFETGNQREYYQFFYRTLKSKL